MELVNIRTSFILSFTLCITDGIIYIDRYTLNFDKNLSNWSVSYFHDQAGNSVVNTSFQTFVTFTKMLIYFNAKVAEDWNDREYRREVIRTVIDLGKFMENTQSNPLLKSYIESLRKGIQFKIVYPMIPATYKMINTTYETLLLPFDVKGSIGYRVVGKVQGQPKTKHVADLTYYGGYLARSRRFA